MSDAWRTPDSNTFKAFMKAGLRDTPLKQGDIPEVGVATINRLKSLDLPPGGHKVDTPQKMMGLFCVFNRDRQQFSAFLERTPPGDGVAPHMARGSMQLGIEPETHNDVSHGIARHPLHNR